MTTPKFTPLRADHDIVVSASHVSIKDPIGGTIADCASPGWATLFASAPDLYAALEEILTICTESQGDCRKRMGTRVGNTIVTARAALAKARGMKGGG